MKSMKYFSYALCAAALAFASCTQPTNGNVGGDKDLVLSASKSEITADGTDKVTFTVKYGEEDVTANASIADAATCKSWHSRPSIMGSFLSPFM